MVKEKLLIICMLLINLTVESTAQSEKQFNAVRFKENPIISFETSSTLGGNINGPSLIKVPDWMPNKLGKYYLYFAHHNGKFIRLAYANKLEGPWKIYEQGTLNVNQTICSSHIASPDVHIDDVKKEIKMYFHGPVKGKEGQYSFLAHSQDGINFMAETEILGESYFRVFQWNENYYAIAKAGEVYKSKNGINNFILQSNPFAKYETEIIHIRHVAVKIQEDTLFVFYSRIGDAPEHIMFSKINLSENVADWNPTKPETVIKPELDYEGVNLPIEVSNSGAAKIKMHELRDPGIYTEGDKTYLLYSIAGESGIAIAELRK